MTNKLAQAGAIGARRALQHWPYMARHAHPLSNLSE